MLIWHRQKDPGQSITFAYCLVGIQRMPAPSQQALHFNFIVSRLPASPPSLRLR